MSNKPKLFSSLFWKIAAVFLITLAALGIIFVYITTNSTEKFYQERNQRLNKDLAQYTLDHVTTFDQNGNVDTTAIQDIMHSMMIINPSVEVYLLDPAGKIITYVAPYKKIKLEEVSLTPIKQFIAEKGENYVLGDDPRFPGEKNIFSTAAIIENEELKGYYYIVLAGEKQGSVSSTLLGSYILSVGAKTFFISLLGAFLFSLLALWLLTRNLSGIIDTVRRFKEGDYNARISNKNQGELTVLGNTFNDMADTIVQNIDQLKAVENLRKELTANISHDLRTPLAVIHGYVETLLMKNDQLPAKNRQHYLNIILSSTNKLNGMVGQLFELSKLEANQIQPEKEPFFINELAQDVLQNYEILAKEKNIKTELKVSEDLPLVFADVALVERVIQNLMDNALKFTPENGKITLELEESNNIVEIKVSDTGPGIPKEEQSYIFERYHRLKTGEVKSKNQGAGLGLAIVKKILEIHSSKIKVISEPNQGTTFFFQLPVYN